MQCLMMASGYWQVCHLRQIPLHVSGISTFSLLVAVKLLLYPTIVTLLCFRYFPRYSVYQLHTFPLILKVLTAMISGVFSLLATAVVLHRVIAIFSDKRNLKPGDHIIHYALHTQSVCLYDNFKV